MPSPLDDPALLHRLAQGDPAALSEAYRRYWQPLFLSAYALLKDRSACEDIVQDLFLQLWLRRAQLNVHTSLKSYLLSATRYGVFRHLRRHPRRLVALPEGEEGPAGGGGAEAALLHRDLSRRVAEAVAALPERCRLIYRLSREEHLSHKEIAGRLRLSPKTVENQIGVALRRLRRSLQEG